VQITKFFIM